MNAFIAWAGELPKRVLVSAVQAYRLLLSPWLGSACRFEPTCSAFALEALTLHGAAAGTYLTLGRLLRCHPLCQGGHEPVPSKAPRLFTALLRHAPVGAADVSPSSPEKTLS
jgi:putative membrane protein insertion efficiency factor